MRAMALTRSSRSVVAFATAILLLLCQTAFAAQACVYSFAPATADVVSPPCHEIAGDAAAPAKQLPAAATSCEAAKAVAEPAKVSLIAVTDLPPILLAFAWNAAPAMQSLTSQTPQAVCFSPPLSILHCRLIN